MAVDNFYFFLAIVPAIVLHEVSHGYVAYLCGDPTAKENHRLTLNPIRHVDLFGTILLPALLLFSGFPAIGYAKPVPVNISRLRKPRSQALYVALAGPATNIVLVALSYAVFKGVVHLGDSRPVVVVLYACYYFGVANILLAAFNLLPIPPLDGSAVIERFVPQRHLPAYYHFRARALPVLMVLIILNAVVFHVGTNALTSLENWWINLLN
ncbi:MAG: site-2 protease family protein [Acidimicrobiales bacterium]